VKQKLLEMQGELKIQYSERKRSVYLSQEDELVEKMMQEHRGIESINIKTHIPQRILFFCMSMEH